MNQNSSVTTGATALSGAALGSIICWVMGLLKMDPPPPDIAGYLGAGLLAVCHWGWKLFGPKEEVVTPLVIDVSHPGSPGPG